VELPLGARDAAQVEAAVGVIRRVLGDGALGGYLYGSAVSSGLRHRSDLDIFVVSGRRTTAAERAYLVDALMRLSGPRAAAGPARSLEVTIADRSDVVPWHYPPRLDFQYGDWFRADYERGGIDPWASPNPDLAVLLTTVLDASRVLFGPAPDRLLEPVPADDLRTAMLDGIPALLADLDDDSANVMLTLARIWMTLETGHIEAKDTAADWALARLPPEHRVVLTRARSVYVGDAADTWQDLRGRLARDAAVVVREIDRVSGGR
jgi:streptomycin 3"-adenylyltransferase